jgi:hypothetical protein
MEKLRLRFKKQMLIFFCNKNHPFPKISDNVFVKLIFHKRLLKNLR